MDGWDMDGDGNIELQGFHGYESATAPGHVLLRILYFLEGSSKPTNTPDGFQTVLSPNMARKLAADLLANADQAEKS